MEDVMRMQLASGSLVETVVTLAAAALMTFAGVAMVEGVVVASGGGTLAVARVAAPAPPG
jgi:hypothetical protein